MPDKHTLVIGLMSGTSLDGMDLALAAIGERKFEILAFQDFPFEAAFQDQLRQFLLAKTFSPAAFISWHVQLGIRMGQNIAEFVRQTGTQQVAAVGVHGPTFFHQPHENPNHNGTFQLGSPAHIHAHCHLPIISDLRNGDMAFGGQGAPLVPFLEHYFFQDPNQDRLFVNLGGIANATFLPRETQPVLAYDTGPANMILDFLVQTQNGGRMDEDGKMARSGRIIPSLLAHWLAHPYFAIQPPKSTGRELFNQDFCSGAQNYSLADQLATATELTALSLCNSIVMSESTFYNQRVFDPIFLSGGGAKNGFLCQRLKHHLPGRHWTTTRELGLDPSAKEALLMALLAYAHVHGIPANIPSVTGARQKVVLGSRTG